MLKYIADLCHLCGYLLWDCKCPGGCTKDVASPTARLKNFSPENLSKLTEQDLAS